MVGNDHEERIGKPRPARCLAEQLPDGIVGVAYGSLSRMWVTVDMYFSRRIGVGTVVARGHDLRKEGLSLLCIGIKDTETLVEDVFVAHTPDVSKRDVFGQNVLAVNDLVAIAAEEVAHIVEVAVAAVEELHVIAEPFQHHTHRKIAHVVLLTLDDAFA